MKIRSIIIFLLSLLMSSYGELYAQISLEECQALAKKNYPLIKQHDLIAKTRDFSVSNAGKAYLPVLNFFGQANYQSDVTTFPKVPGLKFPEFYRQQGKIYGEIDQMIYDAGASAYQKERSRTDATIEDQNLEVNLYALKARVNQIFFGLLLIDEQLQQIELQKQDIQNGIDKARAALANGTAFRSNVDELQAEWLQADRSRIEFTSTREGYLDVLSLFIGKPLDAQTKLSRPDPPALSETLHRPEILLFDYRKKSLDLQERNLNTNLRPRVSLFLQGGYSRPGLNLLDPNFAWYYIGGLRFNWSLGSFYTKANDRRIIDLSRQSLDIEKETFVFNTVASLKKESADIGKFHSLIRADEEIVDLRNSVKKASLAQLENGVITSHDYIAQVNAENRAKQELILHQLQLLLSQYNYQNITGN